MNTERAGRSLPGIPTFLVLLAAAIGLGLLSLWYLVTILIPGFDQPATRCHPVRATLTLGRSRGGGDRTRPTSSAKP